MVVLFLHQVVFTVTAQQSQCDSDTCLFNFLPSFPIKYIFSISRKIVNHQKLSIDVLRHIIDFYILKIWLSLLDSTVSLLFHAAQRLIVGVSVNRLSSWWWLISFSWTPLVFIEWYILYRYPIWKKTNTWFIHWNESNWLSYSNTQNSVKTKVLEEQSPEADALFKELLSTKHCLGGVWIKT